MDVCDTGVDLRAFALGGEPSDLALSVVGPPGGLVKHRGRAPPPLQWPWAGATWRVGRSYRGVRGRRN
eukprot:scaffold14602_cov118-Isochrysis_galbana.AAC.7